MEYQPKPSICKAASMLGLISAVRRLELLGGLSSAGTHASAEINLKGNRHRFLPGAGSTDKSLRPRRLDHRLMLLAHLTA
jgi:hypothetical protein